MARRLVMPGFDKDEDLKNARMEIQKALDEGLGKEGGRVDGGMFYASVVNDQASTGKAPEAFAGEARVFSKVNSSGKMQLVVLFPTGAIQVIATEP